MPKALSSSVSEALPKGARGTGISCGERLLCLRQFPGRGKQGLQRAYSPSFAPQFLPEGNQRQPPDATFQGRGEPLHGGGSGGKQGLQRCLTTALSRAEARQNNIYARGVFQGK